VRGLVNESVVAEALEETKNKFRNERSEGAFRVPYFVEQEDELLRIEIQEEAHVVLRIFSQKLSCLEALILSALEP
jgi:hypothetical protein